MDENEKNKAKSEIKIISEVISQLKYKFQKAGKIADISGDGLSANFLYKVIQGKDVQVRTLLLLLSRLGFSFADFCRLYLKLISVE